jgi:glycogen operon protein
MRNLLATLLLSQGTPMLLAGDEFARTQRGNNNAYCQDNEISWVDWSLAEQNAAQVEFVRQLTRLRRKYPILRRSRFLSAQQNPHIGLKEITWINASGEEMADGNWSDPRMQCFGMLLDGRAQPTGLRQRGVDATLLVILNAHHDVVNFTLPGYDGDERWELLIDTNVEEPLIKTAFAKGDVYAVTARSLLLLQLRGAPA